MFDTHSPNFSNKDRVVILFKEYDTLRSEIISRTDTAQKYAMVSATVIAAIIAYSGREGIRDILSISSIIFIAIVGIYAVYHSMDHTRLMGRYIRNIENEVNRMVGGRELLLWENTLRHRLADKDEADRRMLHVGSSHPG